MRIQADFFSLKLYFRFEKILQDEPGFFEGALQEHEGFGYTML